MTERTLNDEVDNLKNDISKLSGDVAALLSLMKDLGAEKVDGARESLDEEMVKRREELRQRLRDVQARGESAAESLEEEVALHPMRSVMLAFGLGYVAAKLFRGK